MDSLARRKEPKDASFLRSDLERILTALSEHEREEEALVQRALSRP